MSASVVAGVRWTDGVGSLLLGLYGDGGRLNHIGVASSFSAKQRPLVADQLEPLVLEDPTTHPWAEWMEVEAHDGDQRLPGAPHRVGGRALAVEPLAVKDHTFAEELLRCRHVFADDIDEIERTIAQ